MTKWKEEFHALPTFIKKIHNHVDGDRRQYFEERYVLIDESFISSLLEARDKKILAATKEQ